MKLGIDLSAIVLNYFDPSKHDFGEIHLHFEVVDKQFFLQILMLFLFSLLFK